MPDSGSLLFGDYGPRTLVQISGPDAASFLHNLCTQDIRSLAVGECTEAFITTVQGKTLGYVRIFKHADGIFLDSSEGQSAVLLAHFEKYHIREKVEFADLSQHARAFLASQDLVNSWLASEAIEPPTAGKFILATNHGRTLIANGEIAGPGTAYGIFFEREAVERWRLFWNAQQGRTMSAEEVQARRIAAGIVEFGRDVTSDNLPQELARDAKAVSFQKGCYLGQETVARIDALGHVNRLLVRLRGEGNLQLASGAGLERDGKQVGQITSAASWEQQNETWAFGLVRRGQHSPGTELLANQQRLVVVG